MRVHAVVLLMAMAGGTVAAQSKDASVAFEVASIKVSPPYNGGMMRVGCNGGPGRGDPGRITCTNMVMSNLVTMAYGINHYQLADSGSALIGDRYEIAAKVPDGATKEQVQEMWRNLLEERFKIKVHRETRQVQGYEMTVAKGGLKIKESTDTVEPLPPEGLPSGRGPLVKMGADGYPELAPGRTSMAMMNGKARWRASNYTMTSLASMLGAQLGSPVHDATGNTAKYDFDLFWANDSGGMRNAASQPDGGAPLAGLNDAEGGPTLVSAVSSQLGLKLEAKKVPLEMLVVDHIEKAPTEN